MMDLDINYLAIIVAAIIYYVGGAIWYSPLLFAKSWMAAVGLTEEKMKEAQKQAWKSYVTAFFAALLLLPHFTPLQ